MSDEVKYGIDLEAMIYRKINKEYAKSWLDDGSGYGSENGERPADCLERKWNVAGDILQITLSEYIRIFGMLDTGYAITMAFKDRSILVAGRNLQPMKGEAPTREGELDEKKHMLFLGILQ